MKCDHPNCPRRAVKVVGMEDRPNTLRQTHDCCWRHCRRTRRRKKKES